MIHYQNFQRILDREQVILTDNNLQFSGDSGWYENEVYHARRFSSIKLDILSGTITSLEERLWWLSHPNVYITEKILEEVKRFTYVISNKLISLNRPERLSSPSRQRDYQHRHKTLDGHDSHEGSGHGRSDYESSGQRQLMESIGFLYKEIVRISKKSIFKPARRGVLISLENVVETITAHTAAKFDFYDFCANSENTAKKYEDLHADEQLVATALYISLVDMTSNCIVTKDRDIRKILVNILNYLSHAETMEANHILSALIEKPISVYFELDIGRPVCVFDTFKPKESKSAYISPISPIPAEVDKSLRGEIATLLHDILSH